MKVGAYNPIFPSDTSWIIRLLNWLSLFASLLLFMAFFAPHIPPSSSAWVAILGLAMPYIFWISLALVLVLSFFQWKRQLYFLLVLFFGFTQLSTYFSIFPISDDIEGKKIKVMTYNVHVFDMYAGKKGHIKRKKIISFLQKENPDVLALQESYKSDIQGFYNTVDTIRELNDYPYIAEDYLFKNNHKQYFGAIIFSRYPILKKGSIPFPNESYNRCLWADIKVENDTIRFYNMHLGSIRLQKADYEAVGDDKGSKQYYPNSKSQQGILKRLSAAYLKREEQVHLIKGHAEKSPYPNVFLGDINDTPNSYSYSILSKGMKDAHLYNQFGSGGTYLGKLPNFRIDYLFYPDNFGSASYKIHPHNLSDHYALSMDLIIPK
jgi:endonuclease/exonuclease/phosphatase family metal-dependent hydrolase